ncbi:DUF6153 family protein [Streptomyces sp. NPDC048002]|uniref:DUF6153 family protein n=1 Tax=unclassified Streptomyces TaxID=2593676 RepID=UPI0033F7284B
MRATAYVRAGAALGQLLLVVVLALGVFVMHTLGHPEDSSHSGSAGVSHAAPMERSAEGPSTHEPAVPMDMASLCVAVLLGVRLLAALLRSAFARDPDRVARLLAQVAALARPRPPPRGPDLIQLSVLRQ